MKSNPGATFVGRPPESSEASATEAAAALEAQRRGFAGRLPVLWTSSGVRWARVRHWQQWLCVFLSYLFTFFLFLFSQEWRKLFMNTGTNHLPTSAGFRNGGRSVGLPLNLPRKGYPQKISPGIPDPAQCSVHQPLWRWFPNEFHIHIAKRPQTQTD